MVGGRIFQYFVSGLTETSEISAKFSNLDVLSCHEKIWKIDFRPFNTIRYRNKPLKISHLRLYAFKTHLPAYFKMEIFQPPVSGSLLGARKSHTIRLKTRHLVLECTVMRINITLHVECMHVTE